jgi:hypothetical protein
MSTSGTWAFNLDLAEIMEQAHERVGGELRNGYSYRTARISLDLLLLEWQNRGLNLWTIKNASQTLTAGTSDYALSNEKLDIIEGVLRTDAGTTDQTDLNMRRISVSTYSQHTNKLQEGKPTQFFIKHSPDGITVSLWPVPDQAYVFNYWYMERVEDTGKPGSNNVDVPARFLPAMIAGLAYHIGLKTPSAMGIIPQLEKEYERQWELAADSAREKASLRLLPGGYR